MGQMCSPKPSKLTGGSDKHTGDPRIRLACYSNNHRTYPGVRSVAKAMGLFLILMLTTVRGTNVPETVPNPDETLANKYEHDRWLKLENEVKANLLLLEQGKSVLTMCEKEHLSCTWSSERPMTAREL